MFSLRTKCKAKNIFLSGCRKHSRYFKVTPKGTIERMVRTSLEPLKWMVIIASGQEGGVGVGGVGGGGGKWDDFRSSIKLEALRAKRQSPGIIFPNAILDSP